MGVQISGDTGNVLATKGTYTGNLTVGGVLTYEDVTNVDSVGLVTARNGIEIGARPGVAASISVDGNMIVSGISTFGGDIKTSASNIVLGDSGSASDDRLTFGAGTDLQIYHDGTYNWLDAVNNHDTILRAGTAGLYLQGGVVFIGKEGGSEFSIKAISDGAVELYYDNVKRLLTYSGGTKLATDSSIGRLVLSDIDGNFCYQLTGYDSASSTGGRLVVQDADGGVVLDSRASGGNMFLYNTVKLNGNGSVDNLKLVLGAGSDLEIFHDGSTNIINGLYHPIELRHGSEVHIKCVDDGSVELYYDNSMKFTTVSSGVQLQGDNLIGRTANSNAPIIQVTNAQYANSLYIGGWDFGANSSGISRIRNSNNNLHLDSGSGGELYLNAYSDNVTYSRHFRPLTNDTYDLGGNGIRWDDVFATNGTINTSDRTLKNTIVDSDLGLSFINKLKPVSYKFNGKTRTHYGLIAQDVETVLSDISKPTTDFAGFIKTDLPDEYYQEAEPHIPEGKKEGDLKSAAHTEYGLRYTEFISPLIKAVQELSVENAALKARLDAAGL